MTLRYYRLDQPEVRVAWERYDKAQAAFYERCKAFAAGYLGSRPVYGYSAHGTTFHGLRFEPTLTSPLWTVAVEPSGWVQRPRASLPKAFHGRTSVKGDLAVLRQELRALNEAWNRDIPRGRVSLDALWQSMGTNWGEVMFGGMERFRWGDAVFAATRATLRADAVEITGSEFAQAKEQAR